MANKTFEKNQVTITANGQPEEADTHAINPQPNLHLPQLDENGLVSTLQQKVQSSTGTTNETVAESAFEDLEKLIHQYTEEGNIAKLREIENFIVKWQKYVQNQYKKLLNQPEGEQIQPDGKISFEEMSKTVAGKQYSYTRIYWKEKGVKKGKILKNEPQNKMTSKK